MNIKHIAAAAAISAGLGLAGIGTASLAEAQPSAPLPDYHWCPGQWFDPAWGHNWDGGRCHQYGAEAGGQGKSAISADHHC